MHSEVKILVTSLAFGNYYFDDYSCRYRLGFRLGLGLGSGLKVKA